MLKILPRYLIREHIGPFFLALVVIKLLFILNVLYRDLGKFLSKGIALPVILEFLFLNLAWMVALSVPMAVLTATIMAFGRLSADNEITAVRASGVSLYEIFTTILVLAAILAGGLIWFNNRVLPDFNHQLRMLATDITRKKPMINLDPGVIYSDIPNFNILVQKVDEEGSAIKIRDPMSPDVPLDASHNDATAVTTYIENIIIDDQSESHLIKTITARRGEIVFHKHSGLLEIILFDGELHEVNINEPDKFTKLSFPKHVIKMPLTEMLLIRSQSEYRGDREKSADDLMKDVRENRKKIAEKKRQINARVHQKLSELTKPRTDRQKLIGNLIREHQQLARQIQIDLDMIKGYERSIDIYLVEVHKKYAIPAACVVFVLVGAPLGILIRKRGWAVAAGLSIGFFLVYWAFLIGGEILADRQIISPFMAMWSPNFIVGAFGVYLVQKTARDR